MTVRQLGIYAPYTWDVSTAMACVLADLAVSCHVPVSYLAYQRRDTGIHAGWDSRVLSVRRRFFESWASRQSHIVWFGAHKRQVQVAKRLGCHNTLVLLPSRMSQEGVAALRYYDQIVCPNHTSYTVCHFRKVHSRLVEIPWDSGVAFQPKLAPGGGNELRVLVRVEGEMAREQALALIQAIGYLLDGSKDLTFTVGHHRNWSRAAASAWGELRKAHPYRVEFKRKPSRAWRISAYQRHHWFFYPRLRDGAGFYPLESLAVNCPVLAFNLPPINEFIRTAYNGHLIACQGDYNWFGAPQGKSVNRRTLLRELEMIFDCDNYPSDLRQREWKELPRRRDYFASSWRILWGLRDDGSTN